MIKNKEQKKIIISVYRAVTSKNKIKMKRNPNIYNPKKVKSKYR